MKLNLTAIAIVLGFGLVASALFVSGYGEGGPGVRRSTDGIVYGSANAKTTIVEFSDFECPFCARLHPTLKRIVDESDGEINWEFRHLPLPNHHNAEYAAIVSECVAAELGTEAFFLFADRVFEDQSKINRAFLDASATSLGLSEGTLKTCAASEEIASVVTSDRETATALGGSGTPYSVIIFPDGQLKPVSGALPYAQWTALLTQ